jgi:hypothetical protein
MITITTIVIMDAILIMVDFVLISHTILFIRTRGVN